MINTIFCTLLSSFVLGFSSLKRNVAARVSRLEHPRSGIEKGQRLHFIKSLLLSVANGTPRKRFGWQGNHLKLNKNKNNSHSVIYKWGSESLISHFLMVDTFKIIPGNSITLPLHVIKLLVSERAYDAEAQNRP